MYNVLVVDYERKLDALLRSLISGKGYASSLAREEIEMSEKLETGLFDIMFINVSDEAERLSAISKTNALLPHMPVIAVETGECAANNESAKIFYTLTLPLKVNEVNKALYLSGANVSITNNEHRNKRSRLKFRMITTSEQRINCSLLKTSENNILFGIADRLSRDSCVELSRQLISESFDTVIEVSASDGSEPRAVHVQLAYLDKSAGNTVKDIGVRIKPEEFSLVKELLYPNLS